MIKNLIKKGLACLLVLTVLITSSGFTDPAIVYADTISAKAGETSEVDEEIGDTEMSGAESDDTGGSDSESDDANVINSTSGDTDAIDTECDNTEVSEAESSDTEVMDGMTDDTEVIAPESGETNETNTDSENTDMTDDGRTESPEENADALVDDTLEECSCTVEKQPQKQDKDSPPHRYSVCEWSSNTEKCYCSIFIRLLVTFS